MLHFKYSSLIDAPVETVWNFHERSDILEILAPPWPPLKVIRREGGLDVGAISEFRLLIGVFPVRWVARHTACEKYRLFIDEQDIGPMATWTHRHVFAEVAEESGQTRQTRLVDAIDFSLPGGWLVDILFGWAVKAQLESMFRYRHEITKRECERKG